MEKVAGRFGERRLEHLLFLTNGEPLGSPVCDILPEVLPFVLGIALLLGYKVGAEDAWGIRRAKPQSGLGELISAFVTDDALMARRKVDGERVTVVVGEP